MKQEADKYYFLRHQYVVSSGSDKGPPTLALRTASRGQAGGAARMGRQRREPIIRKCCSRLAILTVRTILKLRKDSRNDWFNLIESLPVRCRRARPKYLELCPMLAQSSWSAVSGLVSLPAVDGKNFGEVARLREGGSQLSSP